MTTALAHVVGGHPVVANCLHLKIGQYLAEGLTSTCTKRPRRFRQHIGRHGRWVETDKVHLGLG